MYLVDVIIDSKHTKLKDAYAYEVTQDQYNLLVFGSSVAIDFNHQQQFGYVIKKYQAESLDYQVKPITKIIASDLLSDIQIELVNYLMDNYYCSYHQVFNLIVTKKIRAAFKNWVSLDKLDYKKQLAYEIIDEDVKLTKRQSEVMSLIKAGINTKFDLKENLGVSDSVFDKLIENKAIVKKQISFDYLVPHDLMDKEDVALSHEQLRVYQDILKSDQPYLLHGITSSGKTEIYIKLIHKTLADGHQALFLVPEKTLTATFSARLKNIFGPKIAYVNQDTSEEQMYNYYQKLQSGAIKLVVGTRQSIFLPYKNLGLIIIDEEHSSAYKNMSQPFYNVHDIALFYYNNYDVQVVMGSATPRVESYAKARRDIYGYGYLGYRYLNLKQPEIEIQKVDGHDLIFTPDTMMQIKKELDRDKKVVVLFNKKGHSKQVECGDCNYVFMCPNCNVGLTYYKRDNALRCSCCGFSKQMPKACPKCQSNNFKYLGVAIEQVYEHLDKYFSGLVYQLDGDMAKSKRYLSEVMTKLYSDDKMILLGTQLVATGLDIADVDLVVVPNVDNALFFNDLKARERLYQLLVQVSGRAGRTSGKGRVIIQTMYPNYELFENVVNNDYHKFYESEMQLRKYFKITPYYNICQIIAKHENKKVCDNYLNNLKSRLSGKKEEYICAPVATPYVATQYNKHLSLLQVRYLKSDLLSDLKELCIDAHTQGIELVIDLNVEDSIK